MQLIDELLQRLLLLGSAFQLQQHVLHRQIFRDAAAIILGLRFGMRIAPQRSPVAFINILCNARARALSEFGLRAGSAKVGH